jgi:hypothetical protein
MILALVASVAVAACHRGRHQAADVQPDAQVDAGATEASTQAPVPATDAGQVQAFLTGLYAHYLSSKNDTFDMFGANKTEVFDADTLALLADDKKALKDELGDVDGDLLCDCQDFVSLKSQIVVQSATPTDAEASADVQDIGMPGLTPRHILFKLTKSGGAWRIHDIKAGAQDWLRTTLAEEIKNLKGAAPLIRGPDNGP